VRGDRYRLRGGGEGYGTGGARSGCGALGRKNMGWDVVFIPSEHGTREAGTILIIRSGVSKPLQSGILGIIQRENTA
jgi:hypothetical protein